MTIKLNRRTFTALLGATAAAGASVPRFPKRPVQKCNRRDPAPLHFFAEAPASLTARPRTAAFCYLPIS